MTSQCSSPNARRSRLEMYAVCQAHLDEVLQPRIQPISPLAMMIILPVHLRPRVSHVISEDCLGMTSVCNVGAASIHPPTPLPTLIPRSPCLGMPAFRSCRHRRLRPTCPTSGSLQACRRCPPLSHRLCHHGLLVLIPSVYTPGLSGLSGPPPPATIFQRFNPCMACRPIP